MIRFTVNHEPMGAPRMTRADKWKQRDCVVRYRAFKDAIRLAMIGIPAIDPNDIMSLSWTAYFTPPISWSKKKRAASIGELHRSKPDRDNLDKAILDAMFKEDSAIASGRIEKLWGSVACVEVAIVLGREF